MEVNIVEGQVEIIENGWTQHILANEPRSLVMRAEELERQATKALATADRMRRAADIWQDQLQAFV